MGEKYAATKSKQAARSDLLPMNETDRWQAVIARDRSADGAFVYAVVTTGVFCRPGCSSRTPRRNNVAFFDTANDAITAGYRPCKRCQPDAIVSPFADRAALIERACVQIADRIARAEEIPTVQDLARAAGVSAFHFQRIFKAVTGVTPKQYILAHRAERFRDRLHPGQAPAHSVTAAIYDAGFGSSSRAYAGSRATLGMTPGDYRRGAEGLEIRFSVAPCPLGWVLVAATARGLCCVAFADQPEALHAELVARFPKARICEAGSDFEAWLDAALAIMETPECGRDLPLDIQGTAFQQRVWQALREVPSGDTITYTALADRIGAPGASRAVGRACAANPIAVAIPCHRAVRSDGGLAGYRWGVDRKKALLRREAKSADKNRET